MQLKEIIKKRSSSYNYNNQEIINESILHEIIELTISTPTAYNIQNWQFIAVTSKSKKKELCEASYNQKKIENAAVTFVICGDLHGYKIINSALQPCVNAQQMTHSQRSYWADTVTKAYQHNIMNQRDEAFRTASLAAMTLMLVCEDKGFATGAMSGFEMEKVQKVLGLNNNIIPVMLVTVGTLITPRPEQKKRRHVSTVFKIM